MTNINSIQRRLVHIEPLFKPTNSVLALASAIQFVGVQLAEKKVNVSDSVREKIAAVAKFDSIIIIERKSWVFDYMRQTLLAIAEELPDTEDLNLVRVPESVDSMREVSTVIALANTLLTIIRGLDLLPVAE